MLNMKDLVMKGVVRTEVKEKGKVWEGGSSNTASRCMELRRSCGSATNTI
jgi:hypothetical protein